MKNYFNPTGKLDEDIFLIEEDEDGDVPEPPSGLAKFVLEGNIVAPSFNLETQLTAQVEKNSAFNFEVTSIDE